MMPKFFEMFCLGDLAIYNSKDTGKLALRPFNLVNSRICVAPASDGYHIIPSPELVGCLVEIVEDSDPCPWVNFVHLNKGYPVMASELKRL